MFEFDGFNEWKRLDAPAAKARGTDKLASVSGWGAWSESVLPEKSSALMVRRERQVVETDDHCPHCDHKFVEKGYPRPKWPEGATQAEIDTLFRSGDYDETCPACGGIVDHPLQTDEEIDSRSEWFPGMRDSMRQRRDTKRKRMEGREKTAASNAEYYDPRDLAGDTRKDQHPYGVLCAVCEGKIVSRNRGQQPHYECENGHVCDDAKHLDTKEVIRYTGQMRLGGVDPITMEAAKEKQADFSADLVAAEAVTDTNPTPAQIGAGNYRKGELEVRGFTIRIENPRGSTRKGFDKDGRPWKTVMPFAYGYIKKIKKAVWGGSNGGVQDLETVSHALSAEDSQTVSQLRGKGYNRLRKMAEVSEFLNRHGRTPARYDVGSDQQQQWLLPGKLSLGNCRSAVSEHAKNANAYAEWRHKTPGGLGKGVWTTSGNAGSTPPVRYTFGAGYDQFCKFSGNDKDAEEQTEADGGWGYKMAGGLGGLMWSEGGCYSEKNRSRLEAETGCVGTEFKAEKKAVEAVDGDKLDVFLGPDPENGKIFIIDQNLGGKYDESKTMLGFADESSAKDGYLACYTPDWKGFGAITEMNTDELKEWCAGGQKEPAADWKKRRLAKAAWASFTPSKEAAVPAPAAVVPQHYAATSQVAPTTAAPPPPKPLVPPKQVTPAAPVQPVQKGLGTAMSDFAQDDLASWVVPGSGWLGLPALASAGGRGVHNAVRENAGMPAAVAPTMADKVPGIARKDLESWGVPSWIARPLAGVAGLGSAIPGELNHWMQVADGSELHDANDPAYEGKTVKPFNYREAEEAALGKIEQSGGGFITSTETDENGDPVVITNGDKDGGGKGIRLTGEAAKTVMRMGYVNPALLNKWHGIPMSQFSELQQAPYRVEGRDGLSVAGQYHTGLPETEAEKLQRSGDAVFKLSPLNRNVLDVMQKQEDAARNWRVDNNVRQNYDADLYNREVVDKGGWPAPKKMFASENPNSVVAGDQDGQVGNYTRSVMNEAWKAYNPGDNLVNEYSAEDKRHAEAVARIEREKAETAARNKELATKFDTAAADRQKQIAGIDKPASEKRAWLPELLDTFGVKTPEFKLPSSDAIVRNSMLTRLGSSRVLAEDLDAAEGGNKDVLRNLYYGLKSGERDFRNYQDGINARGWSGLAGLIGKSWKNDINDNFTIKEYLGAPGSSLAEDQFGIVPAAGQRYGNNRSKVQLNPLYWPEELLSGGKADAYRSFAGAANAKGSHGLITATSDLMRRSAGDLAMKGLGAVGLGGNDTLRNAVATASEPNYGNYADDQQGLKDWWSKWIGDPSQAYKDIADNGDTGWGRVGNSALYSALKTPITDVKGMSNSVWNSGRDIFRGWKNLNMGAVGVLGSPRPYNRKLL